MSVNLYHYTKQPLEMIGSKAQKEPETYFDKPTGLWVSACDDDREGTPHGWKDFCEGENFLNLDEATTYRYQVHLRDNHSILFLGSKSEIGVFTDRYGKPCPITKSRERKKLAIDWQKVASDWDGVVVTPYRFDCRMEYRWYYGWDCASGCIWSTASIRQYDLYSGPSLRTSPVRVQTR